MKIDLVMAATMVGTHTNDADDDEASSSSSVNTHEALLDFLGLSSSPQDGDDSDQNGVPCCLEVRDEIVEPKSPTDSTTRIQVPRLCSRHSFPPENCLAIRVQKFFSRLECQQLIERATLNQENGGFQYITEATHTAPDGSTYPVMLQNPNPHKLSVFFHAPTVTRMWRQIETKVYPLLDAFIEERGIGKPLGLNPKLRVLKYDYADNDRFEPHFDATTKVGQHKKSVLTVLLYLNDGDGIDFQGGDTLFLNHHISLRQDSDEGSVTNVVPSTGDVVIFEHDLYHSGAPLEWGTKYVLRTDILFEDKIGEEEQVSENTTCADDDTANKNATMLVADLCTDVLQLNPEKYQILVDMGLAEMTIDSFLSPGEAMLRTMLEDSLDASCVDELLGAATKFQSST